MLRKRDTTPGFEPGLTIDESITSPTVHALRLDGRLEDAVLSPRIHQLVLNMARLRNIVSSLWQEGEDVDFARSRKALEEGDAERPTELQVIRIAQEYMKIHEEKRSRLPPLSVDYITGLHRRVFQEIDAYAVYRPGRLKTEKNGIRDRSTGQWVFEATPPERTVAELESLFEWYGQNRLYWPPAAVAATFFAEFQAIHPFNDGNGRIGRLLNLHILRDLGFKNASLVALDARFFRSGEKYYQKLASTNDGATWNVWARYFCTQLQRAYRDAIRMADFRPLVESQKGQTARDLLVWVLGGSGQWFQRQDYPNEPGHSQSGISAALAALAKSGILDSTGEKKGRKYRLSTAYLEKAFTGDRV